MSSDPEKYTYNTQLRWISERMGNLSSKGKPNIEVATPPEFGGHLGIWSPEDFFLASVEICTLTTFLWFVNKEGLNLKSYRSEARGTVELVGGVLQFTSVTVKVKIGISSEDDRSRVEKALKKVERACLITNSINTDVHIEPEIVIE